MSDDLLTKNNTPQELAADNIFATLHPNNDGWEEIKKNMIEAERQGKLSFLQASDEINNCSQFSFKTVREIEQKRIAGKSARKAI